MRIFVTGASGFIGSAVTAKLREAGHQAVGLARSEATAAKLAAAGVAAARGSMADAGAVREAAAACDGAIHAARAPIGEMPGLDRAAVDAILAGLGGSGKPFLYTSGVWVLGPTGEAAADETAPLRTPTILAWRPVEEQKVLLAPGVRGVVIRPGRVFGRGRGVPADWRRDAVAQGVVRYVGDGENGWPFVDIDDLADLYLLAMGAAAGSLYHAADGPSVKVKELARAAARGARVESIPLEEARRQMGEMADVVTIHQSISSEKARRELGWKPSRKSVFESLEEE